jgi:hypothetical protein
MPVQELRLAAAGFTVLLLKSLSFELCAPLVRMLYTLCDIQVDTTLPMYTAATLNVVSASCHGC